MNEQDLPDDEEDEDEESGRKKPGRKKRTKRDEETKSALYYLTPGELRFVQAIASGKTQVEAIKAAGYRGDGTRGRVRAWRLMQKPVVRAAIYELMCQAFDKTSIEVTQWLRETATIAFMPADMLQGKPKYSDKIKALTLVGDFQKLLERTSPGSQPRSIINLIVQAGNAAKIVEKPVERIERGADSSPEAISVEKTTS
ncbi:MAG TPA: hypothetical protein VNH83_16585 [Bryobacteraceae bacterium]|nr:hypothetical protein [Bryobacteraceae bacterium]